MRLILLIFTVFAGFPATGKSEAADPVRVVIWDEQQPSQKQAYPEFLGDYIAAYLRQQPGLVVTSVSLSSKNKGLEAKQLDNSDVLIWWGHVRNRDVTVQEARPIVERIKRGQLSLIALHSAHWATPFVLAMHERAKIDAINGLPQADRAKARVEFVGRIVRRPPGRDAELSPKVISIEKVSGGATLIRMTRPNCCFPAYRNDGQPSEITTLLPDHPIARGIPEKFTLAHTEMYDEPNHVPQPDAVIFREDWKLGEHFRSGAVWNLGHGKVFYFRPGHETHSVYTEPLPMTIIENAVRWLGADLQARRSAAD